MRWDVWINGLHQSQGNHQMKEELAAISVSTHCCAMMIYSKSKDHAEEECESGCNCSWKHTASWADPPATGSASTAFKPGPRGAQDRHETIFYCQWLTAKLVLPSSEAPRASSCWKLSTHTRHQRLRTLTPISTGFLLLSKAVSNIQDLARPRILSGQSRAESQGENFLTFLHKALYSKLWINTLFRRDQRIFS